MPIFISDNACYRVYFLRELCAVPQRPKSPHPDHYPGLAEGSYGLGANGCSRDRRQKPGRGTQRSLFCSCGQATPVVVGLCRTCYRRERHSVHFFGGNRDSALDHDGRACRGCQSQHYLNVHHRHPGDHTQLVTLCAGCHARVHRTRILRHCLPEILVDLWREWHPDAVEQLRLPVEMSAGVPAGEGWQIKSDFPGRVAAGALPEDESEGGGKQCRIFLPDPAQSSFDWPRETSEGGQEGTGV
jgi:hypothetical protein